MYTTGESSCRRLSNACLWMNDMTLQGIIIIHTLNQWCMIHLISFPLISRRQCVFMTEGEIYNLCSTYNVTYDDILHDLDEGEIGVLMQSFLI